VCFRDLGVLIYSMFHIILGPSGTSAWSKRRLGLQLVAALLNSNYPCIASVCPDASRLTNGVCDCCLFPRKEVYTYAARVVGQCLQVASSSMSDSSGLRPCDEAVDLADSLATKLKTLTTVKQRSQLMEVVCPVTKTWPPFLTRDLVLRLLNYMPTFKSAERAAFMTSLVHMHSSQKDSFDPPLFERLRPDLPALLADTTEFNVSGVNISSTHHYSKYLTYICCLGVPFLIFTDYIKNLAVFTAHAIPAFSRFFVLLGASTPAVATFGAISNSSFP